MDLTSKTSLMLSVQRAMLGEVTGNLAALTAGFDRTRIRLVAYFFVEPTEGDQESIECMASEVIADFHRGYTIDTVCHSLSDGIPKMADFWAFVMAGVRVS